MYTGDNMLAIYASEKALRLAERLGEARCGESRPRDLRPRARPDRRHRARAAEPRALRRAGPRAPTRRRPFARCSPSGTTARFRRPTTRGPAPPTRRPSPSPRSTGDLPSQVELHGALAARPSTAATGTRCEREARRVGFARRARGPLRASSASRADGGLASPGEPADFRRRRPPPSREAAAAGRAGRAARRSPSSDLRARGDPAPAGPLRRCRSRSSSGTRRARARRSCRAIGGGELGSSGGALALRRDAPRRPGRPPRRPPAWRSALRYPAREGGEPRGRGRERGRAGYARPAISPPLATPGWSWSGRSTPRVPSPARPPAHRRRSQERSRGLRSAAESAPQYGVDHLARLGALTPRAGGPADPSSAEPSYSRRKPSNIGGDPARPGGSRRHVLSDRSDALGHLDDAACSARWRRSPPRSRRGRCARCRSAARAAGGSSARR